MRIDAVRQAVFCWCFVLAAGCQTFSPGSPTQNQRDGLLDQSNASSNPLAKSWDQTTRFVTGREQVSRDKAIEHYREGDRLFREASSLSRDEARSKFDQAAQSFKRAADAFPGSALEQDSLFMLGESYFFADRLTKAENAYVKLQKAHPRNRHSAQAGGRLFSIAQYWIDTDKAGGSGFMPINLTDRSRPYLDVSGHGLRVLDQMRYDDPTGKLADDATMAAAIEHLRNKRYLEADQMFTDLREIYPDSEHMFNAHMLGVRCKMEMYAGASYSGLVLEEAGTLIQRTKRIFPRETAEEDNQVYLARAAAEVEYRQAEKLYQRAIYRERQGYYGGATIYHQLLLEKFPDTPFAEQARQHLAKNAEKPEMPPQRLAFLTKLFPSGQPQKPLITPDGQLLR